MDYYLSMFFSYIYQIENDCLLTWITFFVLIYYICNPIMLKIRNQTDMRWFNIALKMLNQESDSVPLLRAISSPWSRSLQTGPFLGVGELGDRPGPRIHGGLASGGKGNAMMKIKVGITPNKRLHGPGLMVFGGSSPRWGPGMGPDAGTRWASMGARDGGRGHSMTPRASEYLEAALIIESVSANWQTTRQISNLFSELANGLVRWRKISYQTVP